MFKRQAQRKKGKTNLIENQFEETVSGFKFGSIELSNKELFLIKLNKLNELSGVPKPGEQFRIVTQKSINSFDFILAILNDETITELIVAFYRIGKKVLQEINELQKESKIIDCHFLVNDAVPKLTPDAYNLLKILENPNWKVRLANNHTKIILMKTNTGNHYIIEGSGNLSINARIEQYSFDNDERLFNFHKKWITEL